MTVDPHDFRMAAGNAVFDSIDVMDEEAIARCDELVAALGELVDYLEQRGVRGVQVASSVAGIVTGWMYARQQGEGPAERQP